MQMQDLNSGLAPAAPSWGSTLKFLALVALLLFGGGQWVAGFVHSKLRGDWADFKSRGRQVDARVIAVETQNRTSTSYDSHTKRHVNSSRQVYLVTVEFEADGERRRQVLESSSHPTTPAGGTVPVVYDPGKPQDVRVEGWNQNVPPLWVLRLIAVVLGLFFFTPVLIMTVTGRFLGSNPHLVRAMAELAEAQKRKRAG